MKCLSQSHMVNWGQNMGFETGLSAPELLTHRREVRSDTENDQRGREGQRRSGRLREAQGRSGRPREAQGYRRLALKAGENMDRASISSNSTVI